MLVAAAVACVLIAFAALGSAMAKLTRNPKIVEQLTGLGVPSSWLPRLAGAEIAGAVGVLVGLVGKLKPLGILAAAGLVLYFVGAIVTHLRGQEQRHCGASRARRGGVSCLGAPSFFVMDVLSIFPVRQRRRQLNHHRRSARWSWT